MSRNLQSSPDNCRIGVRLSLNSYLFFYMNAVCEMLFHISPVLTPVPHSRQFKRMNI